MWNYTGNFRSDGVLDLELLFSGVKFPAIAGGKTSGNTRDNGDFMSNGIWIALLIIAGVAVYTLAKVVSYMRQSERQWKAVDKSKLKEWDDDDDW